MPDREKPAPRQNTLNSNIEPINMLLRPNKSATLPKNSNSDPAVKLFLISLSPLVVNSIVVRTSSLRPST
jgi:hypothetical protein